MQPKFDYRPRFQVCLDWDNVMIKSKNTYHCPFEPRPVIDWLETQGEIVERFAAGSFRAFGTHAERRFVANLKRLDFRIVSDETARKGPNHDDIALACEIVENVNMNPDINTLVIISGDSDLWYPLHYYRSLSVGGLTYSVWVVGFERFTSPLLRRDADLFMPLETLDGRYTRPRR